MRIAPPTARTRFFEDLLCASVTLWPILFESCTGFLEQPADEFEVPEDVPEILDDLLREEDVVDRVVGAERGEEHGGLPARRLHGDP